MVLLTQAPKMPEMLGQFCSVEIEARGDSLFFQIRGHIQIRAVHEKNLQTGKLVGTELEKLAFGIG